MKNLVIAFFGCLFLTAAATAQIQFTADDFIQGFSSTNQSRVNYTASVTSGLGKLMKASGAGVTWDFSAIPFNQNPPATGTTTLLGAVSEAALSNDPDFAKATHAVKFVTANPADGIQYIFYQIDNTGYYTCGTTRDSMGVTSKIQSYSPPLMQYKFPLTYNTSWQSSSTVYSPFAPPGYSITITDSSRIDAYGSLITPTSTKQKGGAIPTSTNNALRESKKSIQVAAFNGIEISNSTTYSYNWLTKSDFSASIIADQTEKPIGGYYTGPGSGSAVDLPNNTEEFLNIRLSANPAANTETKLFYTMKNGGNSQVTLMDALGREVHMLHNGYAPEGQNIIPIDPTSLSAGTYMLHVNAEGISATRKLIITK